MPRWEDAKGGRAIPACPVGKAVGQPHLPRATRITRGVGSWGLQVWGQGEREAINRGCSGLLEEAEVLLGGQAGMRRSVGEHQRRGCRRERQGGEGNQRGDRGIRFRREKERQQGLSHTVWLIWQEPAPRASEPSIPPGSPRHTTVCSAAS